MSPSDDPSSTNAAASQGRKRVHTAALIMAILLCLASCMLMLILNPGSLAVNSVYQGF